MAGRRGSPLEVAVGVGDAMAGARQGLLDAERAVHDVIAKTARDQLAKTATIVPGRDRRFSNWRSAGPLGVTVRSMSAASHGRSAVSVTARGPWGIAEVGAAPHGGHPGTRSSQGKRAWSRGAEATFRALDQEVPERITQAITEGFERA